MVTVITDKLKNQSLEDVSPQPVVVSFALSSCLKFNRPVSMLVVYSPSIMIDNRSDVNLNFVYFVFDYSFQISTAVLSSYATQPGRILGKLC